MNKIGLAVLLLGFSVGCFDDSLTGGPTVTGTYTLRTVNGSQVPYTRPGTATEIIGGAVTLYTTATYAKSLHSRTTVNGQPTDEHLSETGSWTVLGTGVTLRSTGNVVTEAAINANTMTIVEPGMTFVFTKE